MTTHFMSIINWNTVPDTSGSCFLASYDVLATNDQWDHLVFTFNDSGSKIGFFGAFRVPNTFAASPTIVPIWTSTATSGSVVWQLDYRTVGGDDTTSLDQTGTEETASALDAAPTAANRRLTASIAPTAANFAAGETVEFFFNRRCDHASDTMAAAATLHGLYFNYSDT